MVNCKLAIENRELFQFFEGRGSIEVSPITTRQFDTVKDDSPPM